MINQLNTKDDICKLLGENVTVQVLVYYTIREKNKYTQKFSIPKKTGGERHIVAPEKNFKSMQENVKVYLEKLYIEKYKNSKYIENVHGFLKTKSIVTNCEVHVNKRFMLNIDIEDFFTSINFGRVRGLFIKTYGFNEEVATILAQIVTIDGKLAQGSPSSPIISNMICYRMDKEIFNLCQEYNCSYSRYADDITISSNDIRYYTEKDLFYEKLDKIITRSGFTINLSKVRFRKANQRMEVTGLVVNEHINTSKEYTKELRLLLHKCSMDGILQTSKVYCAKIGKTFDTDDDYQNYLKQVLLGKIAFLGMATNKSSKYENYLSKYATIIDSSIYKKRKYSKRFMPLTELEKLEDKVKETYIKELLVNGENFYIEFKESYTKKALHAVKAFYNSYGGHIFFGVNDDAQIVGINLSDSSLDERKLEIQTSINNINGFSNSDMLCLVIDTKTIIIVEIKPTDGALHYETDGSIYRRTDCNNQKIKDETHKRNYINNRNRQLNKNKST